MPVCALYVKVFMCARACCCRSTCPFAHPREKARRRDPRSYEYEPLPCPDDKKGSNCPRGVACSYTHNVYVSQPRLFAAVHVRCCH